VTLEEMEKRLRRLEDIEEIRQLQIRYVNCLIQTKWDEIMDCFTDDAIIDLHAGYCRGKEEFAKVIKAKISLAHIGEEGNFVVHPIINVNGDTATGSWLFYIQYAQPREMNPVPTIFKTNKAPKWMQGYYEMEYKRVKGQWKISMLKWQARLVSPLTTLKSYKAK
jgi:hypothetical protein